MIVCKTRAGAYKDHLTMFPILLPLYKGGPSKVFVDIFYIMGLFPNAAVSESVSEVINDKKFVFTGLPSPCL